MLRFFVYVVTEADRRTRGRRAVVTRVLSKLICGPSLCSTAESLQESLIKPTSLLQSSADTSPSTRNTSSRGCSLLTDCWHCAGTQRGQAAGGIALLRLRDPSRLRERDNIDDPHRRIEYCNSSSSSRVLSFIKLQALIIFIFFRIPSKVTLGLTFHLEVVEKKQKMKLIFAQVKTEGPLTLPQPLPCMLAPGQVRP